MGSPFWIEKVFGRPLSLVLALSLASPLTAQDVSPALLQAALEAYQQGQQKKPEILPLAQVDPNLVGKKVVVYYHDGRQERGKLLQLTAEKIQLQTRAGAHEIPLAEVGSVQKQPSRAGRNAMIIWLVGLGVFVTLIVGAGTVDD